MKPEIVVQSGHISRIFNCRFSPDGNFLLTSSYDETIRLWDLRLGCELRVFNGHRGPVYDACFSPDGSLIASVSYDRTVRIWETATGLTRTVYADLPRHLYKVQFDASGAFLTAGGPGKVTPGGSKQPGEYDIYIWSLQSGQLIRQFNFPIFSLAWTMGFCTLRGGSVLATCGQKKNWLFLHDIASGEQIARIKVQRDLLGGDLNVTNELSCTPDERTLILSSNQALTQLIDLASRRVTGSLASAEPFHQVQVHRDGTLAGFGEKSVELWDMEQLTRIRTIPVAAEAASPDLKLLAGIDNLKIVLWDAGSGKEIWRMGSELSMREFYGNRSRMFALASNPIFPMIATGGPDGFVRLWDLRSGKGPRAIKAHTSRVNALAFNPAGTLLASGSNQGNVSIWEPLTGNLVSEIGYSKGKSGPPIESLGFSPDGHFLVADNEAGTECIDLLQFQVRSLEHPDNPFPGAGVIFEADSAHFLSTILDRVLYWDVESGHSDFLGFDVPVDDLKVPDLKVILAAPDGKGTFSTMTVDFEPIITAMAADPAGKTVFAYGYFQWVHGQLLNQTPSVRMNQPALVAIFDPADGKLRTLRGGSPFVRAICINNEGSRIATGCSDGSVTLWNLAEGESPITWQAHSSDVSGIAFTSDGRFLATFGLDSAVRLWKADTHDAGCHDGLPE